MAAIRTAIDLGCNFIDTAQGYGNGRSESIIGRVLKDLGPSRRVYVTTKIPPAAGPWPPSPYCRVEDRWPKGYIAERLEASLKALQTDTIDVVLLHTWTRAWNRDPQPLAELSRLKQQGKLRAVGVSTPEHDQNALIDLMRHGHIDATQVIFNIFEQEPAAEFLPVAAERGIGVIARMPFDEGVLAGRYTETTTFEEGDFRRNYFAGDRLARAVRRTRAVAETVGSREPSLATAAIKFSLSHPAVATVIPGIRNPEQAKMNISVGENPTLAPGLAEELRKHAWNKAFWYAGK